MSKGTQIKVAEHSFAAASGSACFQLDKQTWRRKKQWYTEGDKISWYLAEIFTVIVF